MGPVPIGGPAASFRSLVLMTTLFDPDTRAGAFALHALEEDLVAWLTTVAADGTPQSSVVSFIWDGEAIGVFSSPTAPKVRNIRANPRVGFHFNTDEMGYQWAVIDGTAELIDGLRWNALPAFDRKYRSVFPNWGMDIDETADAFRQFIRITPTAVRLWTED